MQPEAPHTPPLRNVQTLPPDTVAVSRHTSGANYRTGDLKLGRAAVLADLQRYLQVPFDCLLKRVGGLPPLQDLQRIRNNLTKSKILTDDERSEENVFEPLGRIIDRILAETPNRRASFAANPNVTPLSERNNTSRPDGYLVLSKEKNKRKIHWFDIAVPFEFKKAQDRESLRDDEEKIIWSLHSIMREDICRRFAFGITIEGTQLRLWLTNRAFLAVTQPINFFQNVDSVISLFYALGSASASSFMKELGWDPTVKRIHDGEKFRYKFTIRDEVFTTTRELATYGADSMVGRGTRVYEATDAEGNKVAVKDSWRDFGRLSEGKILENILASCAERLSPEELVDAKNHFVQVRLWEDVTIDDAPDETLNLTVAEEHSHTRVWVSIDANPILSATPHLPSTGDIPDSGRPFDLLCPRFDNPRDKDTSIPRRVHTRTVFHDVGVALKDVTSLVDILSCLSDALKALYYLHKSGFVHRDFSVGNVIRVGGVGKLGDFEYAKRIDSNISHDVRTGTRHFMAVEVESQKYLFFPRLPLSQSGTTDAPPFRMNFLHDIESVWWVFTWVFFYHTDMGTANSHDSNVFDAQTQWNQYHVAFPDTIGHTKRRDFFIDYVELQKTCQKCISETCQKVCSDIAFFACDIQGNYVTAEKEYPLLTLSDILLEDMHSKAAKYLRKAQCCAQKLGIELCPLPDLLKHKRSRPQNETSLAPINQGKKARMT
ncbi:uncharacterized protein EDB93DRAFT_1182709 [Suillus bovinus]|uniref:uncharacterized protein n=1 Tax=Suillus bovinus TaxID=48563 RepID=UPI001B87A139|nr:uncharacterized protein EDB93DRAFT_1182709 [Suillus bovinus]KAG2129418.1 hypothetical protein EDB93DRAFT_1182709 [Suillus bovinus]